MKIDAEIRNKWETLHKNVLRTPLSIFSNYSKVMKMLEAKASTYQNS
jgi:hypothetical protein